MPLTADVLAALSSPDASRVREAAQRVLKDLRTGGDRDALGAALEPLAAHSDAAVRKVAADAAELLPDAIADRILPALLEDLNAYVKDAALLAQRRISARRAAADREAAEQRKRAALYDAIRAKDGEEARARAEAAAQREKDDYRRAFRHEGMKLLTPLDRSIRRALAEADKPRLNRAALRDELAKALEHVGMLSAVLGASSGHYREERLLPLLEQAVRDLADRLGPRAELLAASIDVPASLAIDAYAPGLLQAFQNVLQNAAEAYPEGERIEIRILARSCRDGSHVELAFADEGPGMSDEERRALAPFQTKKPEGSGLGLFIARMKVEEMHGGTLDIESAAGQGTTVTMVLPVRRGGASS